MNVLYSVTVAMKKAITDKKKNKKAEKEEEEQEKVLKVDTTKRNGRLGSSKLKIMKLNSSKKTSMNLWRETRSLRRDLEFTQTHKSLDLTYQQRSRTKSNAKTCIDGS